MNYVNVEGERSINESNLPPLTIVQKHHLSAWNVQTRHQPLRGKIAQHPTERRTGVKRAGTVNNGTRVAKKMRVTARFVWNHMWLCKPRSRPVYSLHFDPPLYESPGLKGILSYWDSCTHCSTGHVGDFLSAILHLLFEKLYDALLIDLVITWLNVQ